MAEAEEKPGDAKKIKGPYEVWRQETWGKDPVPVMHQATLEEAEVYVKQHREFHANHQFEIRKVGK